MPSEPVSVVVTACNCGPHLLSALQSAQSALDLFAREFPAVPAEGVVVDDGSSDDTPQVAQRFTAGRAQWKVVRRPKPSSPSCARNTGVRHARGTVLFFLDGDDLFLPRHVTACYRALTEGGVDFVKGGVVLADPVHPDWQRRIEHSLAINLCVRRRCHEEVGSFPDWHLFRRSGEEMRHEADIFFKQEDQFYCSLLAEMFPGASLREKTVEYRRHPGNAYDRQYEKFRRPFGQHPESLSDDERFRLSLAESIFQEQLARLRRGRATQTGRTAVPSPSLVVARAALESGSAAQAEQLCRQALASGEASGEAWLLLGEALQAQGKQGESAQALEQALRRQPGCAEAHFRLGQAQAALGQRESALGHYRECVRLSPAHAEGHSALGVALAERGRLEEGLAHLREAAVRKPDSAAYQHNLGVALAQRGEPEEAEASLRRALALRPDYAEACYNLGAVLVGQGRREEGIASYRRAVELRPGYADAYNNLGLALTEAGRHGEAAVLLRQAVRLRPQGVEGHNNLGLALSGLGRFAEAESALQEALRLQPGYAEGHTNLGSVYKEQGKLEEALACYELALLLEPGSASAHYNHSLALLAAGRWQEGWKEYEWRWRRKRSRPRTFREPAWDGSALEGKTVLLHMEQGLGDMIQFIRYAPLVKGQGGVVVVECPAFLVPLFSTCVGIDWLVAEGEALPPFDVQAPLMSLPGLLGTTPENAPAVVPYLAAQPERVLRWRGWLGEGAGLRVGVVWQGNPHFEWDRWRSFPLALLEPLAQVEGVELISLQKGHGSEQVRGLGGRFAVRELPPGWDEWGGFLDTAALMTQLDLVVSADTSSAHLAGALGVPCWLALAAVSDWRWLRGGEDTPWYPSLRLFRQERLGEWGTVFERMAQELGRLAERKGGAVRVEVSPGELLDKMSILRIKSERIKEEEKLAHVRAELALLLRARERDVAESEELRGLEAELKSVNEALWDAEDGLRLCERAGEFGGRFVELARSVYRLNDRRGELKRWINALLGSALVEEKAYPAYK